MVRFIAESYNRGARPSATKHLRKGRCVRMATATRMPLSELCSAMSGVYCLVAKGNEIGSFELRVT